MSLLTAVLARVPASWMNTLAGMRHRHYSVDLCASFIAGLIRGRDSYIQTGAGRGLLFNPGRSAASYVLGNHEPETQVLLADLLRPGMTFYDIGANVGFCSIISARMVAPGGQVISFEPLPENVAALRHNAAINHFSHVTVFETALSDRDGEMSFAMSERPTWGKLHSISVPPDRHLNDIKVSVRRLDSLVDEADLPFPQIIKMDVEGAENDVLEGARETLRRGRPVLLIELHGTGAQVLQTLSQLDYCVLALGPWRHVGEAHWNAMIAGVPSERPDLMRVIAGDRLELANPNGGADAA
jgi:FkbM family methyltransferase